MNAYQMPTSTSSTRTGTSILINESYAVERNEALGEACVPAVAQFTLLQTSKTCVAPEEVMRLRQQDHIFCPDGAGRSLCYAKAPERPGDNARNR